MRHIFAALMALFISIPAFADIEIQEVTSPGGITAWLVEEHSIPFTAIEIRFKGGASLDAPGKRGAINLMTELLEEGAANRNAREFAAEARALAVRFSYNIKDDYLNISASVLTENREEALELLRTTLIEPRFDQDAVDRIRGKVMSGTEFVNDNEYGAFAADMFMRLAFGDHPYGTPIEGTTDSIEQLTREDLIDAKNRIMAKDRINIAVVGDITADELGPMLDRLLGDLPETGAPMPERVQAKLTGGISVFKAHQPQSVIAFGHKGINRNDDDFFTAHILNQVIGGGGVYSRLPNELRVKRGLIYAVSTGLLSKDLTNLYVGKVATSNEQAAEVIDVIRAEWAKLAENGITEEELASAKAYLIGESLLRFDGNVATASILADIQFFDLPIDYIETQNAEIAAVTLEDVKRVAARLLDPEGLRFVVVGMPEGLTSD